MRHNIFLRNFKIVARQVQLETNDSTDTMTPIKPDAENSHQSPSCGHEASIDHDDYTKDLDTFHLVVTLKQISNVLRCPNHLHWISYDFLGATVHSSKFLPSSPESFEPKEDVFKLRLSQSMISSFLKGHHMKVNLCQEGHVNEIIDVDLSMVFCREGTSYLNQYLAEGWIGLRPCNTDELMLNNTNNILHQIPLKQQPCVLLSLELVKGQDHIQSKGSDVQRIMESNCNNDIKTWCPSSEDLLQKMKDIAKAEMLLDEKQKQWNDLKLREELRFRQHVKKKEKVIQHYLEQQLKQQESKHMETIETCRIDYKKLESRLREALSDVETKEREMGRIVAANNTTFVQKVSELDLKEKLMREEAQHAVDLEVCMRIVLQL